MPTMRTGRTWRPVWRASSPIPGWNGLISPVVVRVPSGNRTTCQPAARRPSAAAMESAPRPVRLNANAPNQAAMNQRDFLVAK